MTDRESDVIKLAIDMRRSKFSVEEAVLWQQFTHAVDMLIMERRNATAEAAKKKRENEPNE